MSSWPRCVHFIILRVGESLVGNTYVVLNYLPIRQTTKVTIAHAHLNETKLLILRLVSTFFSSTDRNNRYL